MDLVKIIELKNSIPGVSLIVPRTPVSLVSLNLSTLLTTKFSPKSLKSVLSLEEMHHCSAICGQSHEEGPMWAGRCMDAPRSHPCSCLCLGQV